MRKVRQFCTRKYRKVYPVCKIRQFCTRLCIQVVASYAVVISHDNHGGAIPPAKEPEILGGRESGKLPRERNDLHAVYTKGCQQLLLLFHAGKQPELAGILLQHRPGMGPEGDDNGLLSPFTGRGDHGLQNITVSQMDPVKKAGRYYTHLTHSKLWRCGRSGFLANTRAPTW